MQENATVARSPHPHPSQDRRPQMFVICFILFHFVSLSSIYNALNDIVRKVFWDPTYTCFEMIWRFAVFVPCPSDTFTSRLDIWLDLSNFRTCFHNLTKRNILRDQQFRSRQITLVCLAHFDSMLAHYSSCDEVSFEFLAVRLRSCHPSCHTASKTKTAQRKLTSEEECSLFNFQISFNKPSTNQNHATLRKISKVYSV